MDPRECSELCNGYRNKMQLTLQQHRSTYTWILNNEYIFHLQIQSTVDQKQYFQLRFGNLLMWIANCMYCSMLFYPRHLSFTNFGILGALERAVAKFGKSKVLQYMNFQQH